MIKQTLLDMIDYFRSRIEELSDYEKECVQTISSLNKPSPLCYGFVVEQYYVSYCKPSQVQGDHVQQGDIHVGSMSVNSLILYLALFLVGSPMDEDSSIPDKVLGILSPILLWCTCPPFCANTRVGKDM